MNQFLRKNISNKLFAFPPWQEKLYFSSPDDIDLIKYLYKPHSLQAKIGIYLLNNKFLTFFLLPFYKSNSTIIKNFKKNKTFAAIRGSNEDRLKYIAAYKTDKGLVFEKFCNLYSDARIDIMREKRFLNYFRHSSLSSKIDCPNLLEFNKSNFISLKTLDVCNQNSGTPFSFLPSPTLQDAEKFCAYTYNESKNSYNYQTSIVQNIFYKIEKKIDLTIYDHKNKNIELSFCHGDLTPWNLKLASDRFAIVDLEHSRLRFPPYYDLHGKKKSVVTNCKTMQNQSTLDTLQLKNQIIHEIECVKI